MFTDSIVREVLRCWDLEAESIPIAEVNRSDAFSGARLWRLKGTKGERSLRRWPAAMSLRRLQEVHRLQSHVGRRLPEVVPSHFPARDGATVVRYDDALWDLAEWKPGAATTLGRTTHDQRAAAMQTLAAFHVSAAEYSLAVGDIGYRCAPGIVERADRIDALLAGKLDVLAADFARLADDPSRQLMDRAFECVRNTLPSLKRSLSRHRQTRLPLQWCHGDARSAHVLFCGREVTGLIDLGAIAIDTVVRDVARLASDLAASSPEWDAAIDAYQTVRPLSEKERIVCAACAESQIPLAIASWLSWLSPNRGAAWTGGRRDAGLARLMELVERL